MHDIWKRERELGDFIRHVASSPKGEGVRLYSVVSIVQTYFELVTKALVGNLKDEDWQGTRIQKLGDTRSIDQKTRDILTIVNTLRNDMLHDPLSLFQRYKLDQSNLIDFKKKLDEPIQAEELKQELSIAEDPDRLLEDKFSWAVVLAYVKVYNAHHQEVQKNINSYIASLP